MSFNESNNKTMIAFLIFIIYSIIIINTIYSNKIMKTERKIEELKRIENLKDDEILKLKSKIESVNKKLIEKEDEILNLKENLNEIKNENKELKKRLEKYDNLRKLDVIATAYTSECDGCIGITATGYDVRNTVYKDGYRVVATDKNVIPLGSILYIESKDNSFEPFIAISYDVGGAIKGNRIDILMENKTKAYNFGVKNARVIILKEG